MNVANIKSFNFAFRIIEEARLQGIIRQTEMEDATCYEAPSS